MVQAEQLKVAVPYFTKQPTDIYGVFEALSESQRSSLRYLWQRGYTSVFYFVREPLVEKSGKLVIPCEAATKGSMTNA